MAQEEQIIDLLLDMQRSSDSNAQSFDSLLNKISAKLDYVDNKPSIELLRTYVKELSTSIEDKYSSTQNKFSDIEKALKAVYTLQGEQIKNSEIKELFDIFSKNVNNFSVESKQNKAVLTGIEGKLSDLINNKTDKEDILRTISLLRKDFENVNNVYKHTIDDVNSNLKTIISGLIKLDPLKTNEAVKSQIDIMYNAINGIVIQLQSLDKRNDSLEKILTNVATSEDLKLTKGIIDELLEKNSQIEHAINNLSEATSDINKKVLTNEDIADLMQQTEDVLNNANDIKNALGKMTNDLNQKPDSDIIETSLKDIYKKMINLTENISAANVKGDVFDISTRLTSIKDELYTIKNIVGDLNDSVNTKVTEALDTIENGAEEFKKEISEVLSQIPTKETINNILSENNDVLKELVNKASYIADNVASIPAVIEKVEAIKESQSDLSEDIASSLSKLNFEKEFSCIYDKTSSIENWLEKSNIKENSEKIVRQMEKHTEQSDMTVLNTQIEGIVKNLEDLSQSRDIGKVGNNITDIGSKIDNLTKLVKNLQKDDSLKILSRLSNIESKVAHIASVEEFSSFVNEVRRCVAQIGSGHNGVGDDLNDIRTNQNELNERLSNLDFSEVTKFLEGKFGELEDKISSIIEAEEEIKKTSTDIGDEIGSLSGYIKSNLPVDTEYLERQMAEIKNIIETEKNNDNSKDSASIEAIEQYTKEIRQILDNQPCASVKEELNEKISSIEAQIIHCKEFNENAFLQVLNKIDEFGENALNNINGENNLSAYLDELSDLKDQVMEISYELKEADYKKEQIENAKHDERVSIFNNFISEKIAELSKNFEKLTNGAGNNLKDQFNYNTELIEAKTSEIIKFIEEIKNSNDGNSEFALTLEDTSAKLADMKQELEFLSTDITEAVNLQAEKIFNEFSPIREILLSQTVNSDLSELKSKITELHNDLIAENELSSDSSKLETLYSKVTEKLVESENNLKDFILSDTDSIILKLDGMKDFVEKALNGFSPITNFSPANNDEIANFTQELKDFRIEQNEKLQNILELVNAAGLEHQNIASLVQDGINKQQELATVVAERIENQGDIASLVKENTQNQQNIEQLIKNNIDGQKDLSSLIRTKFDELPDVTELIQNNADTQQDIVNLVKEASSKQQELSDLVKNRIENQGDVAALVQENIQSQQKIENLVQENLNAQKDLSSLIQTKFDEQLDVAEVIQENANTSKNIETLLNSAIEKQDSISFQLDEGFINQKENMLTNQDELKSLIAVAMNHDDIVGEIKNLQSEFTDKLLLLDEISKALQNNPKDSIKDEINKIVDDLKDTFAQYSVRIDKLSMKNQDIETVLDTISNKIDDLLQISANVMNSPDNIAEIHDFDDISDKFDFIQAFDILQQDISELRNSINKSISTAHIANAGPNSNLMTELSAKADVVMQSLESNDAVLDSFGYRLEELINSLGNRAVLDFNFETALNKTKDNWLSDIKNYLNDSNINSMLKTINDKLDILATTDGAELLEDISYTLSDVDNNIVPAVKILSESDKRITSMLETLNSKINNVLSKEANSQNIEDIKNLIIEQKDYISKFEPNEGIDAFKKCLDELSGEVNDLNSNANAGNEQLKKSLHDMKDSIMAAVVAIFDQVSFVEETEDIKDFVEERTNEINKNIESLTKQLKQMTTTEDDDYTYSMQDIETDLSKLRLAIKEIGEGTSDNNLTDELSEISTKLKEVATSVDSMTQDEIQSLKSEISSLKEQTQFLIATSDKSYNALNSGLDDFGEIIQDNLAGKVDTITSMLEKSEVSDNVIKQALVYMGEWIDSTTGSFNKIHENSEGLEQINNALNNLSNNVETCISNSVDAKLKKLEKKLANIESLEEQFAQQDERIDRLEKNLDKILSAIENLEDSGISRKIDKIEKQISKLSTNIEKLTSYVDD